MSDNSEILKILQVGDDVMYMDIQHKVVKVWNRGTNRACYDLEGEHSMLQKKVIRSSVSWQLIELVTTTPSV